MASSPLSSPPTQPHAATAEAALLGRWFTGIRRDGFLGHLNPEAWHTLSAVLSFTRRDGSRRFTLDQFATVISQSRDEAARRLQALTAVHWKGSPLLSLQIDPTGQVWEAALAPVERLAQVEPTAFTTESPTAPPDRLPADLARELATIGLNASQIDSLVRRYSAAALRRQLAWLPARGARNPAALFIRAVEQDWTEPKGAV